MVRCGERKQGGPGGKNTGRGRLKKLFSKANARNGRRVRGLGFQLTIPCKPDDKQETGKSAGALT